MATLDILKSIKIFSRFTDAELNEILGLGAPCVFEAHGNIMIEGELSGSLFLIVKGKVSIFKSGGNNGETYDVAEVGEGGFFGEMSLIDDNPRSATVRASTDCRLFEIRKEAFLRFLEASPDRKLRFYENCVRDLVSRIRRLDDNFIVSQYQLWKTALKGKEVA